MDVYGNDDRRAFVGAVRRIQKGLGDNFGKLFDFCNGGDSIYL